MEPVSIFKNQMEIDSSLKWWMHKLFLDDWIISCKVLPKAEFDEDDCAGENLLSFENKCAVIHLIDPKDYPDDSIMKLCHEKILVHELLHCIYNFIGPSKDLYESVFMDAKDHQQLESMAKTLIMVKYNISLDWFYSKD